MIAITITELCDDLMYSIRADRGDAERRPDRSTTPTMPMPVLLMKQLVCICCIMAMLLVFLRPSFSFSILPTRAPRHGQERESSYFVAFTEDGQESVGDIATDKNTTVRGKAGSVFRTSRGEVKVLAGCLMFQTADSDIYVKTKLGVFKISSHSSVLIEELDNSENVSLLKGALQGYFGTSTFSVKESQTIRIRRKSSAQFQISLVPNHVASDLPRSASSNAPACIFAKSGAKFSARNGKLNVAKGSMFIDLSRGVRVSTPGGDLLSLESCLVSIRMFHNTLCIENCSGSAHVNFIVRGVTLRLAPGMCSILKRGRPTVEMIPLDGVARRQFEARFDGSLTAILADFQPFSLMRSNAAYLPSLSCPTSKHEAQIGNKLIKAAAIVPTVTAHRGPFGLRPQTLPVTRLGTFLNPLPRLGLSFISR